MDQNSQSTKVYTGKNLPPNSPPANQFPCLEATTAIDFLSILQRKLNPYKQT